MLIVDTASQTRVMFFFHKRDCVVCNTLPSCPRCKADEECLLTTQTCESCPKTYCSNKALASQGISPSHNKKSSTTGGIIGGIIGGLAVLAIIVVLWKYYQTRHSTKKAINEFKADEKSLQVDSNSPSHENDNNEATESGSTISSFSFTRSSNVIPVAYIPGVTTRQTPYPNGSAPTTSDIIPLSTGPSISQSVATTAYRESPAVIGSAMMTAIHAKPNLVTLDKSKLGANNAQIAQS